MNVNGLGQLAFSLRGVRTVENKMKLALSVVVAACLVSGSLAYRDDCLQEGECLGGIPLSNSEVAG